MKRWSVDKNGLSHEMDLAFDDMQGQFWLKQGMQQFLNFLCALMILKCKVYFFG